MAKVSYISQYENPLAQAAEASSNLAKSFRDCLESAEVIGEAQGAVFSGAAADLIVEGWQELDDNDDKEALASFKASMARECRKLHGFGCKVRDGKLIGTQVGKGKKAVAEEITPAELIEAATGEVESDLVAIVRQIEMKADAEQVAKLKATLETVLAGL